MHWPRKVKKNSPGNFRQAVGREQKQSMRGWETRSRKILALPILLGRKILFREHQKVSLEMWNGSMWDDLKVRWRETLSIFKLVCAFGINVSHCSESTLQEWRIHSDCCLRYWLLGLQSWELSWELPALSQSGLFYPSLHPLLGGSSHPVLADAREQRLVMGSIGDITEVLS